MMKENCFFYFFGEVIIRKALLSYLVDLFYHNNLDNHMDSYLDKSYITINSNYY